MAHEPDWAALEQTPEFRELGERRRRFVAVALTIFTVWFGGFLILAAYARDFMTKQPIGSISWAYILALSLIAMTWGIAYAYLRWSDSRLEPLAERARRTAEEAERG
ncbi:MAG TPA: DUF485 domain-containing protein [Thermoleophilaceae bacterium]|jgi:uncharacterized membrane protein (DUF485 family)